MTADRYTTILLDLDGTLVDSAAGILESLRAAFEECGVPFDPGRITRELLGPPLYTTLPSIVGAAEAAAVMPVYRRIYRETGLRKATPYPEIDELLPDLVAAGFRLGLATSKAEPAARDILADQGWTELFTAITGDTVDAQRPSKAAVVGEALRRLGNPGAAETIMVGDRLHDVVGSRAHGIGCHGAGWGYGEPGELESAGALIIHSAPGELRASLLAYA